MFKLLKSMVTIPAAQSASAAAAQRAAARGMSRPASAPATSQAINWSALRSTERQQDQVLNPIAAAWANRLSPALFPTHLLDRYPRVANRLALCWNDAVLTERLFDDLLMDKRSGRQGFPAPVAAELKRLYQHFHANHIIADPHNPWDVQSQAVTDR